MNNSYLGNCQPPALFYRIGCETTTKSWSGILIYMLVMKITVVFQRALLQATLPPSQGQNLKKMEKCKMYKHRDADRSVCPYRISFADPGGISLISSGRNWRLVKAVIIRKFNFRGLSYNLQS